LKTSALFQTTRHWVCGSLFCICFGVLAFQLPMAVMGQSIFSTPYTFTTLAGSPGAAGTNDGTGSAARFYLPTGIAVDSADNVYVADIANATIRKVTQAGVVTTLAGLPGVPGTNDGIGTAARFDGPVGVAADTNGNIYVADRINCTIRKLAPVGTNWMVTTIAGLAGNYGTNDGTNGDARFYIPYAVAVDTNGTLYAADLANSTIRKVTPVGTNWVVTTLAGLAGSSGTNDGAGTAARFYLPSGVAVDRNGNVYVADQGNDTIREVTAAGMVTTIAGQPGIEGTNDGAGSASQFYYPNGLTVDASNNIYVADLGNNTIREVRPAGTNWTVTTLAGQPLFPGPNDGSGSAAQFNYPYSVAIDSAGCIYVGDTDNAVVRKGYPASSIPAPVMQLPSLGAGQFGFGITGLPNLAVDVQSSSDLINWQMADTNYLVLVGGTNSFTDPSPQQANQFYRVRVR
jgi:sugar lactone lactonase YvrE